MAVVTPLYNNAGDIQEMSTTQVNEILGHIVYLYSTDPGVTMSVVASNGNLASISDTRLQAGAQSTSVTGFPSEATTAEPSIVTVTYDKMSSATKGTSLTSDTGNLYPCYYDASNDIKAMSLQDIKDTFIHPAIDLLTAGTTTSQQGGTYYISSTNTAPAGSTLVSGTAVYSDTRANTGAYTAGSIPEALDQPQTLTNYYLMRLTPGTVTYTAPLYLRSDNDLQQYPETDFNTMLLNLINYTAESSTDGYRISYNVGTSGSGNTRGSGMVDTRLNGSGNYQQRFVNADDYRAQEFPNGTAVTINTYYLRINKS